MPDRLSESIRLGDLIGLDYKQTVNGFTLFQLLELDATDRDGGSIYRYCHASSTACVNVFDYKNGSRVSVMKLSIEESRARVLFPE
jgi:hypothetical protein